MQPTEISKLALSSISDALKTLVMTKEVVAVHIRQGHTITGAVTQVGPQLVQLSELAPNRQFFDALVQVSEIVAIEVRVRK